MKYAIGFILLLALAACNQQGGNTQQLQAQIDSLQHKLDSTYKPGFGEFMSSIQVHHNKLWFAGTNNNWKLADFEITEIKEREIVDVYEPREEGLVRVEQKRFLTIIEVTLTK